MNLTPTLQHCSCCSPTPHTHRAESSPLYYPFVALFLSACLVPEDGVQPPRTAVSGLRPPRNGFIYYLLTGNHWVQASRGLSPCVRGHLPSLFLVAPFCAASSNSRLTPPQPASETSFQRMVINLQEGLRVLAMTQPCNSVTHLEFHEVKNAGSVLCFCFCFECWSLRFEP